MADDDLDDVVRRTDPDRWLSSRFIGNRDHRADVVALYAFDHQLERARRVASNVLMAEIRLAWWREVLDEAWAGGPVRAHPVAEAVTAAIRRHHLPRGPFEAMIDGRVDVLERPGLSLDEAVAWADSVAGSAAVLAATILDINAPAEAARAAGRVWGLLRLMNAARLDAVDAARRIRADLPAASRAARRLGVAAFPSVAHATLARGRPGGRPFLRPARLLWAVSTGRI